MKRASGRRRGWTPRCRWRTRRAGGGRPSCPCARWPTRSVSLMTPLVRSTLALVFLWSLYAEPTMRREPMLLTKARNTSLLNLGSWSRSTTRTLGKPADRGPKPAPLRRHNGTWARGTVQLEFRAAARAARAHGWPQHPTRSHASDHDDCRPLLPRGHCQAGPGGQGSGLPRHSESGSD
jgi:hypothetical protein